MIVMKHIRGLIVGALALAALPAMAQDYPKQAVHLVVPVAAGGGSDLLARAIAEKLSPLLGQPVVIDNKPGGGGVAGIASVISSTPDGYTLAHVGSAAVTTAALDPKIPYDLERDLEPIIALAQIPLVLVVHPDLPVKSVKELIAHAKQKPGAVDFASFNPGSASQFAGELLKYQAGIDMVHVPYRGSAPALLDVLSGRVPILFDAISTSLPHINAGKLRPLAVTTLQRSKALPDTPTMVEQGLPDYQVSAWVAVFAPKGTPAAAIATINSGINKVLADPSVKASLENQGWQVMGGSRDELRNFVTSELRKYRAVVEALKLKPE